MTRSKKSQRRERNKKKRKFRHTPGNSGPYENLIKSKPTTGQAEEFLEQRYKDHCYHTGKKGGIIKEKSFFFLERITMIENIAYGFLEGDSKDKELANHMFSICHDLSEKYSNSEAA